jgi:hypothetical protein
LRYQARVPGTLIDGEIDFGSKITLKFRPVYEFDHGAKGCLWAGAKHHLLEYLGKNVTVKGLT